MFEEKKSIRGLIYLRLFSNMYHYIKYFKEINCNLSNFKLLTNAHCKHTTLREVLVSVEERI